MLRIGCFGDSFTWGSELRDGDDFPARLQALYREAGRGEVEVINFGNPAFGLHQTHLLWDRVGRRYGLDRVLLAPRGFWAPRDTTFTNPYAGKRVLHGRYVAEGEGLRLVAPVGDTPWERAALYQRFVPPWVYLRYDRSAPPFLRAWLPRGRTVANPFYYDRRSAEDEAADLMRRLLEGWAAEAPRLAVLDLDGEVGELPAGVRRVRVDVPRGFPHRAPWNHPSAWAQRHVAAQVFAALESGPPPPAPVVVRRGRRDGVGPDGDAVFVGDRPVGSAFRYPPGRTPEERLAAGAPLLAVELSGGGVPGAVLFELEASPPRDLELEAGGRRRALRPVLVAPGLWSVVLCGSAGEGVGEPCVLRHARSGGAPRAAGALAVLRSGDRVLAAVSRAPRGRLEVAAARPYVLLRADAERASDPAGLGEAGAVWWRGAAIARWERAAP